MAESMESETAKYKIYPFSWLQLLATLMPLTHFLAIEGQIPFSMIVVRLL